MKAKNTSIDELFRRATNAHLPPETKLRAEGWVSAADIVKKFNISFDTAMRHLRALEKSGKIESCIARNQRGLKVTMWRAKK